MIRTAARDDLASLVAMEKAASTAGLAHVFPAELAFPVDDVRARWVLVLDDPCVTVLLDEADGRPVGYAAYGDGWLRHFGVVPAWWGSGRAQRLHDYVLASMPAGSGGVVRLWVLTENHRARAFYARQGWRDSGVRETEVFAPYPLKMQMERDATVG